MHQHDPQRERQTVPQPEHHRLHDRQPDQVRVASHPEFLQLLVSQTIIQLSKPSQVQMEHPVIVEVELPEAGVVLAEVVVPEAVAVEEGDNKL